MDVPKLGFGQCGGGFLLISREHFPERRPLVEKRIRPNPLAVVLFWPLPGIPEESLTWNTAASAVLATACDTRGILYKVSDWSC